MAFNGYVSFSMKLPRCAVMLLLGVLTVPWAAPAWAAPVQEQLLVEAKPAAQKASAAGEKKKSAQPAAKPKVSEKKSAPPKKTPAKASRSADRKKAEVIAAPLPKAKLDLRLPPEMVEKMQPVDQIEADIRKPLLPSMFGEKPASDSPFQLNGRLLSNEMQLQLRNDSRQDVEGAAIDFEFKQ